MIFHPLLFYNENELPLLFHRLREYNDFTFQHLSANYKPEHSMENFFFSINFASIPQVYQHSHSAFREGCVLRVVAV